MRVIITGMKGTVAPALAARLRADGDEVIAWDRAADPPTDEAATRAFIERHAPAWVCHVATGDPTWAEWIARVCGERGIGLLWTGSVSVFGDRHRAPLGVELEPDATDDYGRYKIDCERRVMNANPRAIVARLGWQIGDAAGSNNMVDYLTKLAKENGGRVEVSRGWVPSTAMLGDSAEAMRNLMRRGVPGIYHLEGNSAGLSMYEIATRLKRKLGAEWDVVGTDAPVRDNRMVDERVVMGQVADRLR